ncbi:DUF2069 domain-containing protein [Ferrimonas senticii]|uniref:DUF2069 domain-containing protein n=1 Tax=Ferrimonas senticii TaxID=394566 RepID=UPI0004009CF7|nr:DUF2069 domain-containing protein [Ferrimonas senticii]
MSKSSQPLASSKHWLRLAQGSYLSALALLLIWTATAARDTSSWFQWLLLLPLLLPAVGLLQGKPYTHAWSGFIAALYLLSSATAWWVYPDERVIASATILCLLAWLLGSTYFARYRGRELGLGLKRPDST